MNHDATHCIDYRRKCPKECYRVKLAEDLYDRWEELSGIPLPFASLKNTKECPLEHEEREKKMITIKRNTLGDTRTAEKFPTISEFIDSNVNHRRDVETLMKFISRKISAAGMDHDWSKTREPYESMFYQNMYETMVHGAQFEDGKWAKLHYEELERHHLKRHVPEDVNLVDVIEMICDCVAAGLARSGSVRDINIDSDTLQKAVKNTVKMLTDEVEVRRGD